MSLRETIVSDMKSAMKAREMDKVSTLRMVQSSLKNKEIELRPNELTEKDVQSVLKKLVKQRKDSIEQYQNAGREDLAAKEQQELDVISSYLPEPMSEELIVKFVEEAIAETGASSMKDMGKLMQVIMAKTQGAADNKVISQIVKSKLS